MILPPLRLVPQAGPAPPCRPARLGAQAQGGQDQGGKA